MGIEEAYGHNGSYTVQGVYAPQPMRHIHAPGPRTDTVNVYRHGVEQWTMEEVARYAPEWLPYLLRVGRGRWQIVINV